MTQEEKQLLLKDLCARIPYRPKGVKLNKFGDENITVTGYNGRFIETIDDEIKVERVRLYLRPMSSMTDEEIDRMWEIYESGPAAESSVAIAEYLYERHLDCHYLIEKGLALEAPESMYKTD